LHAFDGFHEDTRSGFELSSRLDSRIVHLVGSRRRRWPDTKARSGWRILRVQPAVGHSEVGFEINESLAQIDIRFGSDVYTPRASDAKALAKKISPFLPTWHPPDMGARLTRSCAFPIATRKGAGFGHVFYGTRGENFEK
jgi:hypothetical protein